MSLEAAAAGRFKAVIDRLLPLSQAALAHEIVAARSGIGKVVLDATRI
jgi:NADPH:quinone reductase-like Zn-dependent oxidoreductase